MCYLNDNMPKRKNSETPEKKKVIRGESTVKNEKRIQKYRPEWEQNKEFKSWLRSVPNKPNRAQCILCPSPAEMTADISVIKGHQQGQKHINAVKGIGNIDKNKIDSAFKKIEHANDLKEKTKIAEIKICGLIASENLALNIASKMTKTIKSVAVDSEIMQRVTLGKTKATGIIKYVIAKLHFEELCLIIKTQKFSFLIDESTDIGTVKSMTINIRYRDETNQKIVTQFWCLLQVKLEVSNENKIEGATAEKLFSQLLNEFESADVPTKNIIGFGSDGCNTMFGNKNSVVTRLEELCPGIFTMKCVCHSLHLCVSEACTELHRACEDLARNTFNYFNHSNNRQAQFRHFQTICEVEPHKLLKLSQTRWLSLTEVVKRILEQWDALNEFFQHKYKEERLIAAESMASQYQDNFLKMQFYFVDWVLPKFANANKYFQGDTVLITELDVVMRRLLQELLEAFIRPEILARKDLHEIDPQYTSYHKPLNEMYLGINVMRELQTKNIYEKKEQVTDFLHRCRKFLVRVCVEIRKRYDFGKNNILTSIFCLHPKIATSSTDLKRPKSLMEMMLQAPRIINTNDTELMQKIDNQWCALKFFDAPEDWFFEQGKSKPIENFWFKLKNYKNILDENEFQELADFVLDIFLYPHSSAACERTFSKLNLIKTAVRNKLSIPTINGLMLSSQAVKQAGGPDKFVPSKTMLSYMTANNLYPNNVQDENSESEND